MNSVIERFASTYTYLRQNVGSYIKGRWQDAGAAAPVSFRASIQPLTGRELMILPEGERTKDRIRIYTETALVIANQVTKEKGDIVAYDGRSWEVQSVFAWNLNDYPHFKYFAQLVEADS